MLDFVSQKKILEPLVKKLENHMCADCDTISPTWASLDFGVFLCSNCAGAHRGLGPTVTRVRSTNLDLWHSDWVGNMQIGNIEINAYWEADKSFFDKKPKMGAPLNDINRYVFEKYIKRKFVKETHTQDPLTLFKQGTYHHKPKPTIIVETPHLKPIKSEPHSAQKKVNKEQDLIDFFNSEVSQKAQPNFTGKNPQIQIEEEDEFTDFTEAGTSFTNESKESFVNFDNLLSQQQNKMNGQPGGQVAHHLHHSISQQEMRHVPLNMYYPQGNVSNNLVYNAHLSQHMGVQQGWMHMGQGQYLGMNGMQNGMNSPNWY